MGVWHLAFRNLLRHRGRLILNLILLVGAFLTILCLKGFQNHVLLTIQELVIDTQYGHLQVAKKSFWDNSPIELATDRMVAHSTELMEKIAKIEGVKFVSPRVSFYGLVNTEDQSIAAHFIGLQPAVETRAQTSVVFLEGSEFSKPKEAILSVGLQNKLKIKKNSEITIVSPTLSGGMNAMDLSVAGVFSSGFADVDNSTVYLNLSDAQKVLDTDFVDQLMITLYGETSRGVSESQIAKVKAQIQKLLPDETLQVRSWREMAELYDQVESFFQFQNLFIEVIILLLLFLSAANTVSMTVFERLNEIGTLRALGDYETDIQRLFLRESILLGGLAILVSLPMSYLVIQLVAGLKIAFVLPMASQPIDFKLIPSLGAYVEASFVCFTAVVVASLWPSKKASRVSIVTALAAKI